MVLKIVLWVNLVLLAIALVVVPIGAYYWHKALTEARESVKVLAELNKELKKFVEVFER